MASGKCIICRRYHSKGRHIDDSYILCLQCGRKWLFYPVGRYVRKRDSHSRWKHQDQLRDTISTILRPFGIRKESIYTEVGFPEWGTSIRGGLLRFDVVVPKLRLLVEYHGMQHYKYPNRYHKTEGEYKVQKSNDRRKVALTAENGWHYLTLSYREDVGSEEWVRRRMEEVITLK